MYRVAKKTTKKTQGHCLKCKYSKELREIAGGCNRRMYRAESLHDVGI